MASFRLYMVGSPVCGYTQRMLPVVRSYVADLRRQGWNITGLYINGLTTPELNGKLGIRVTPTFFLVRDGKMIARADGFMETPAFAQWMNDYLFRYAGTTVGGPVRINVDEQDFRSPKPVGPGTPLPTSATAGGWGSSGCACSSAPSFDNGLWMPSWFRGWTLP